MALYKKVSLIFCLALYGCGQSGPLYLPKEDRTADTPMIEASLTEDSPSEVFEE